jgi:predicted flavoprotein YhiN
MESPVRTQAGVEKVEPLHDGRFRIQHFRMKKRPFHADAVVIATGGSNRRMKAYQWLEELGHTIRPPVPSLFTFNFSKQSVQ